MKYDGPTSANFTVQPKGSPVAFPALADTAVVGRASEDFFVFLPKVLMKYQINKESFVYTSVSRGYKAGGHNIQIFADLLQEALQTKMKTMMPSAVGENMPSTSDSSIEDRITYKPEYNRNYEIGGHTIC